MGVEARMLSADAARAIAEHSDGALVVVTMTTIFMWPEDCATPKIRCAPLMGGASTIGLGLALGRPDKKVLVLDGDGSLLMQLGSLATIAGAAPANLVHFVFDNGVLYEGGGRLPVAAPVDFCGLALAAGYAGAQSFTDLADLRAALPALLATAGPLLVRLAIELPPTPGWSADNPHAELPDWWFTMLHEDSRSMRATLA